MEFSFQEMLAAVKAEQAEEAAQRRMRIAVDGRDGRLFAGNVQVTTDYDRRIHEHVRQALSLSAYSRMHRCAECNAWFIAYRAARLCSAECRKKAQAKRSQKANEKRRESRQYWRQRSREEIWIKCAHCGEEKEADRRTRRFCSDPCRQAAYRKRKA